MFVKLLLVGVAIFAVMVAVKDGRVLRATGLTGSCTVVSTAPNGIQVEACKKGKLHGAPDLAGKGCTSTGTLNGEIYWRCPPNP
jgi:hypothetical protein